MVRAWIDGDPATLEAATAAAAQLLGSSRFPLISGLGTDVAGARAAIGLAQRLRGAVDHMHSGTLLRDLDVMREAGMMLTTPNEARVRADLLLLIGPGLTAAWPALSQRLFTAPAASEPAGTARRVIWLCPGRGAERASAPGVDVQIVSGKAEDLPALLAAVRARLAGRPSGKTRHSARAIDALVADLESARFGVAIWSAAEIDALTIEMLCGIVNDLNKKSRFSGLPFPPADNAFGVLQVCGWSTALPLRTSFGRGDAEHDPWRFDAARLVETEEADCVLWISAYRGCAPPWTRSIPMIALTGPDAPFRRAPRVQIETGRPGTDHDAVEHLAQTGTLGPVAATTPTEKISVARVIARIAAALPNPGAGPC